MRKFPHSTITRVETGLQCMIVLGELVWCRSVNWFWSMAVISFDIVSWELTGPWVECSPHSEGNRAGLPAEFCICFLKKGLKNRHRRRSVTKNQESSHRFSQNQLYFYFSPPQAPLSALFHSQCQHLFKIWRFSEIWPRKFYITGVRVFQKVEHFDFFT